jgi:glucoamylase
MEQLAGPERLLPEQSWDKESIPERDLWPGGPTGSPRPLLWAHAEYVKLLRSRLDGEIFERVPAVVERYRRGRPRDLVPLVWTFRRQPASLLPGRIWRILAPRPFRLRWSSDEWNTRHERKSSDDSWLGVSYFDLDVPPDQRGPIRFTFFWPETGHWAGGDFTIFPGAS